MNYQQTLDYLYNTLPMFSRMGSAAYKKDLTNIRILCQHLGDPHRQFKSIHVAGTNGKGSVSHMLAAILQMAGYKTGLYTSPHLYDFRERIKINGNMIPEDYVVRFVEEIKPLAEKVEPSFFEISVGMAFKYFAEEKVDIAIIEVGLGGRLDSTNIVTPELSIITNIGWDHMNILGDSLQAIAREKGGIIKQSVPVIIGETIPETKTVFQRIAAEKDAPIVFAEDEFEIKDYTFSNSVLAVRYRKADDSELSVHTDLAGIYQAKNMRTVLASLPLLEKKGWRIGQATSPLQRVKKSTGLGGRWEVIHQHPTVILEVAHNVNGIEQMLLHLNQLAFGKLHVVIGMVKDKEADGILDLLPRDATYYFTQARIPRALDATLLKQKAEAYQLMGEEFNEVNLALDAALRNATKEDLIIVCGSIFLVAEVNREAFNT